LILKVSKLANLRVAAVNELVFASHAGCSVLAFSRKLAKAIQALEREPVTMVIAVNAEHCITLPSNGAAGTNALQPRKASAMACVTMLIAA
jgi:hypothetical protein